MTQTPLDAAHAAMDAAPQDDAARLRFYERLADSELTVMLQGAAADDLAPELFDLDGARFVLVFDREERLARFAGRPVPYAALPGRALMAMLAGQGIGLALNLDVAPSAILLPPEAVDWMAQTLEHAPEERTARAQSVHAPAGLPETLLTALDARLAAAGGLARRAYLAAVRYADGTQGHLLGLTGTVEGAEPALARAINEALVFSGLEAGALDVAFLADSDPLTAQLARIALRFDLPEPAAPEHVVPATPGSDPEKPPRLR